MFNNTLTTKKANNVVTCDFSPLTVLDISLIKKGSHHRLYEKLGSHIVDMGSKKGAYFSVWAPNAKQVFVTGDFNGWNKECNPLAMRQDTSGIWEGFIPGSKKGDMYKYFIISNYDNYTVEKKRSVFHL